VNNYIKTVEEETLSVYPLQIMSTGFDFTTMLVGMGGTSSDDGDDSSTASSGQPTGTIRNEVFGELEEGHVGEARIISRMFASFGNNDLAALKAYFDSDESGIEKHVSSIYYEYAVTPQIFDADTSKGVRRINPDSSLSALGMGSDAYTNSLMSMSMSSDMFSEMMESSIVADQYNVVAGHWPEKYNELVLVLSPTGRINDFLSYVLGLRDPAELKEMVKQFSAEEDVQMPDTQIDVTYEDLLNMRFKLVNASDYYRYDSEYGVWVDKSGDDEYMKGVVDDAEELRIVGIVQAKPEANALALTMGIYYTQDLTRHIVENASESQIVKDQLADRDRDVFSGKTFEEIENEDSENAFDMSSLFTIDEGAMTAAFSFDATAFDLSGMDMSDMDFSNMDPSSMPDMQNMDLPSRDMAGIGSPETTPQLTTDDIAAQCPELDNAAIAEIVSGIDVQYTDGGAAMNAAMSNIMQGYFLWAMEHPDGQVSEYLDTPEVQAQIAQAGTTIDTDNLQQQLTEAVAARLGTDASGLNAEVSRRVTQAYAERVGTALQQQMMAAMQKYMTDVMSMYMTQMTSSLQAQVGVVMQKYMTRLSETIQNAMGSIGFDANAFANAFQFNMDEDELADLMASMMRVEEHSYDNNLKKLGYADFDKPSEISLFPRDFESKEHVIEILDDYNANMKKVDEDKVISYTDIVGTLMESVTDIVNMISYVLIAFVAISLIVSSIMIGVITYISVLERKKEIGILRAIGASKGDISRVFNAETVIEGLIAGILGVGVTALGCIPANIIVYNEFDVPNVALLPVDAAVILVIISVFLTFIAGLIPSRSASRKDPVEALRSE